MKSKLRVWQVSPTDSKHHVYCWAVLPYTMGGWTAFLAPSHWFARQDNLFWICQISLQEKKKFLKTHQRENTVALQITGLYSSQASSYDNIYKH